MGLGSKDQVKELFNAPKADNKLDHRAQYYERHQEMLDNLALRNSNGIDDEGLVKHKQKVLNHI